MNGELLLDQNQNGRECLFCQLSNSQQLLSEWEQGHNNTETLKVSVLDKVGHETVERNQDLWEFYMSGLNKAK